MAFTALVCMGCGLEVAKSDWRIIGKASEQPTKKQHIKKVEEEHAHHN